MTAAPTSPLIWTDDGQPRSRLFGDVYFSTQDGLSETRAVFLQGCGLPKAWAGRRRFVVGELGFGTQELPFAGRDIQDEKILGTFHLATGRSDHLGGHLTPDKFANRQNATHDDILFAPPKTPEIQAPQVRMHREGKTVVLLENYQPAAYMQGLLAG